MNIPNKLTLARFVLSAVYFAVMVAGFEHNYLIALIIFIIASITDYLDGRIARKKNIVTDFGKFLDPIADKMLTTAAFIAFTFSHVGCGVAIVTFMILAREFIVASIRLIAADNGKVIAANMWGKVKTVMQMIAIIATMALKYVIDVFGLSGDFALALEIIYTVLLWAAGILTLISGIVYAVQNKEFINSRK